ncbi:MAG: hypothetical protein IKF19_02090 [Bacilli bacterium]|nr:hypothetical protein [Bacilli bacterium]
MEKIDKVLKLFEMSINMRVDLFRLGDVIDTNDLLSNGLMEYSNTPISKFFSLIRINKLRQLGLIDDEKQEELNEELNNYYEIRDKISDMTYYNIISEKDEYDDSVCKYYDMLDYSYHVLDEYKVLYNQNSNKISQIVTNDIGKRKIRRK